MPEWLPIAIGLLVLYVPTFYDLLNGLWTTDEQGHGPIILALCIWLFHRQWPRMLEGTDGQSPASAGWLILGVGLILYVIGRSQMILMFEVGSFLWVVTALLLLKRGRSAPGILWFPLFFLLFMIPLPSGLVTLLTMPMKIAVSYVTEFVLFWLGYPIARSGVTLQIGPYHLLVADACAGLQTLFTLEALGLFYLNLVRRTSVFRNISLAVLIVPISFSANVIRVMVLTLVTYYFGDAAGQGFMHGFAGIVLFMSALILIVAADSLLHRLEKARSLANNQTMRIGR